MGSIADDGHCIWYGECGRDAMGKVKNCYYNGTAQLLTDYNALKTMKSICSMFYNELETYTCCAPDQIRSLYDQLGLYKLMLGRCPSCFYNFRSLLCSMTCHPQQSHFINVTEFGRSTLYPDKLTVESITTVLADDFPQRILDSCRDVLYPGGTQHSLDVVCGHPYNQCTKELLLNYIGIENPASQFPVYFILRNNTFQNNYYNQSTFLCSESVITKYENQSMCQHLDCPTAPIPPDVPGKYSNISIRTTELIIMPDNQTFTYKNYLSPPAPISEIHVGPALNLDFLTRVFDLQRDILNLEGHLPPNNISVRLTDICFKPTNNNCGVFSVLQYFQNSRDNLNKTTGDEFFLYADYITHIYQCSSKLYGYYDTLLNISCFADFGGIIQPSIILPNYPSTESVIGAKALVLTIIIEDSNEPEKIQKADAWEQAFKTYMQNFTDTQEFLRNTGRWNELANFSVYYTNEHVIKNELNTMIWSNNQSNII